MSQRKFRLLAAPLILSIATLACPALSQTSTAIPAAEKARGEWGSFGVQTQHMDRAAKPGDDFDRYVNGKWNDTAQIPPDKTRIGAFVTLGDLSEERVKGLVEGLGARKWPAGSPQARISAVYGAFMDEAGINARGLAPAKPYLDRIASISSRDQLISIFATDGFAAPVGLGVAADAKDSNRYALHIGQAGIGLPDRDFYLVDNPRFIEIRAKYLDYLAFLLGKAGYADARQAALTVLALETEIARTMWDRTIARDRDLTYNKLTMAELDGLAPGGAARQLLGALQVQDAPYFIVPAVPPTSAEVAEAKLTPEQLAKLGGGLPATLKLIDEVPLASWRAWLAVRFLNDHASVLPADVDAASFAFYGTVLNGQQAQRPRWKRAISAVEGQIGELLGQIYAQRYYPAASRREMARLIANLRRAMAANLADLAWMSPATRREAEAKLNAFTAKIGAPAKFKRYEGLTVSANDPLANQIAAGQWAWNFERARIAKPVDRSEWMMLPQTVNAYYYSTYNEIVFPAAILQPPFFNLNADPAVNYGAIGAVIGHEMGHGFDDQGSKSDGNGNMRNWWTQQDKAAFDALTGRLATQYSSFCPYDDGKTCSNGKLTLGENIGDVGGLSLAYRAYQLSLNGKPAPVIDGTTGDQRFFMAWAQVWRAKSREASERQRLITGPHSLERFRINGVVRNFDEWYRAFNVQQGDKLYLPPEDRVRIW
jgi:putative endopeptidase